MTISAENQNKDKVDKETTAEDLTKGMDASNNNAPQGGKEEVSGKVTETNANRHIFDMRIEFLTSAHSAVDTFSIVPGHQRTRNTTTRNDTRDLNPSYSGQFCIL